MQIVVVMRIASVVESKSIFLPFFSTFYVSTSSSRTLKCIPHDFVCDGEHDCPGGEDELYCYGIQNNHNADGFYEVMQQEFGVWHTKCFPKSKPPTQEDLIEICRTMGYINPQHAKARARVDNETGIIILKCDFFE